MSGVCQNCGCDPSSACPGTRINRHAWLSSQIVSLREAIPKLEKQARRTPPKTLLDEWRKVQNARLALSISRDLLVEYERKREEVKP